VDLITERNLFLIPTDRLDRTFLHYVYCIENNDIPIV